MTLNGKRFALLVEGLYEDQEFWYPLQRLREAGADVVVVGPEAETTYKSKYGYPAVSDKMATQIAVDDVDGVIIPGGYAPDRMRRHKSMVNLVRQAYHDGKIVAAICHGGWLLCSADVLQGRKATSFSAIQVDMENAGANWIDRDVVRDANLITSRTPDDLPAFMREIIAAAAETPEQEVVRERAHHAG